VAAARKQHAVTLHSDSDAGTNLKVERGGGTHPARGANFFVVPLNFFDYTSTIIVVLLSAFVMGSTIWSSVLFAVRILMPWCFPPCPVICKSGGTCPRALWSPLWCTPTSCNEAIFDGVINNKCESQSCLQSST